MSTSKSAMPNWDIRNEGRAWRGEEAFARYMLKPHKIELIKGRLLSTSDDRETFIRAVA